MFNPLAAPVGTQMMATKQSKAALIPLVENGIRDVGDLPPNKFYVLVRDIDVSGSPPNKIVASVLVRFLPSGVPFCCDEPGCYSRVFCDSGADELGDYLRRKMNLRQTVTVELRCAVEYFDNFEFTAFQGRPTTHAPQSSLRESPNS
jgi:hypothetical protein